MHIKKNLVDLFNGLIYPAEVGISMGKITSINSINEPVEGYMLPGFIDSHVHIESSMLVPSEFAFEAVKHGTIGVVTDPHEIANVLGIAGVDYMIENSRSVPLKFFFGAPSCVPATDFESSGSKLGQEEIELLLKRDDIFYLSEMMNYPGVIYKEEEVIRKIETAQKCNKPIDGHAPSLRGEELKKYCGAGITTDHEAFTLEEAKEKIKYGMKILIREGSAARNMKALAPLYDTHPEMLMLCSDDIHPEMLVKRHINGMVKYLVANGYNLYNVLKSACVNPVDHYGLDVGLLRTGDSADFIVVDDVKDFCVRETWIRGEKVCTEGKPLFKTKRADRPNNFNCSVLNVKDIEIKNRSSRARVIEIKDGELYTWGALEKWSSEELLKSDTEKDILKLVVKERYKDLPASVGFIRGFGLKEGAIACSVAHDSHNIIAVGADDASIIEAINTIVREKGGLSIYAKDRTEVIPLPVAGIMTDVPCGTIAQQYTELSEKVNNMGSQLKAPFMTLSFMSLLVIPELKLGDRGLFNGLNFEFTNLFEDGDGTYG